MPRPDFGALREMVDGVYERRRKLEQIALTSCTKNKHNVPHNTRLMMIQSKAVGWQGLMPDEEELAERPDFWEMEPEREPPPVVRPKMTEGERGIFSPQNIWGEGWKVPERQYPDLGSAAEQAQFMLEKIKENAQSPQKSEPIGPKIKEKAIEIVEYSPLVNFIQASIGKDFEGDLDAEERIGKLNTGLELIVEGIEGMGMGGSLKVKGFGGKAGGLSVKELLNNPKVKPKGNVKFKRGSLKNKVKSKSVGRKYAGKPYSGKRNPEVDFAKGKRLTEHFNDHKGDFGYKTEQEYLAGARNFLEKPITETTQSFVSDGGTYFRYDTATNEFGIINKYGGVSTYFKPKPENYWYAQIVKYAPK